MSLFSFFLLLLPITSSLRHSGVTLMPGCLSTNNTGPYLTGPSGYPSPDPTGMGYMMDGQHAAAAAMMQARPHGDVGYDYPHAYGYYGHL
jgi:hypothetical protein